jgi:YYY domain-containing protein
MRLHEARFLSLIALAVSTFTLSIFVPFKTAFYTCFIILLSLSAYTIAKSKVKIEKTESVFLVVFVYFIFLRFLNPDIFDSEKFMDMAFINAVLRAESIPPNDPFFASKKLDFYYYFGHVISANVCLMSFSPSEIGYNIAVAALPAYSAIMVFGLLREFLSERWAVAGLSFPIFSGNLYSVVDFFRRIITGSKIDGGYYWNATRVIEHTINEFPYFSFIHADLHAHVVAIPIKLLILLILYRIWQGNSKYSIILIPLLFATFATNSWDLPLMVLLCIFVAMISSKRERVLILSCLAVSALPIFIFYSAMNAPAAKLLFVEEKTDLTQFLLYAAFPLLFAYTYFSKVSFRFIYALPLAAISYFISPILLLIAPLAAISAWRMTKKDFMSALILVGTISFIIPEFIAIESRLNTVFKFYLTGWLFLTVPPATKLGEIKRHWKPAIYIFLVLCLIYPLAATPVKYSTRAMTLDGMQFMRNFDGDYYAIKWLKDRKGVVLEEGCTQGGLCGYRYGGRVAAFTGNPAVIAWTNHEFVWRRDYSMISERAKDVRTFYTAKSCEEMMKIVEKYNASYIFLGYEERRVLNADPEVIGMCFKKVYEFRSTAIFAKSLS